jgi:hypothetical protein
VKNAFLIIFVSLVYLPMNLFTTLYISEKLKQQPTRDLGSVIFIRLRQQQAKLRKFHDLTRESAILRRDVVLEQNIFKSKGKKQRAIHIRYTQSILFLQPTNVSLLMLFLLVVFLLF